MGSITDIIAQVQVYVATLSGIRQADALPPNMVSTSLASVCYPQTSHLVQEPCGMMDETHELLIEISCPAQDLARDTARLAPFVKSVPMLLFKKYNEDKWNHTVQVIGDIDVNWPPQYDDGGQRRKCIQVVVHKVKFFEEIT